jgi:CxxC motif-containing protein (DUF1111 family)
VREFVRDALTNEMGMTLPDEGSPFGDLADTDAVPDPEVGTADIDDITFFLALLDFSPKLAPTAQTQQGETLFTQIGCAKCHIPVLDGVEAYSDVLLHDVHGPSFQGVTQGMATSGLYRTAPLRGLRFSSPYFHDGRSETLDQAVRRHAGEATAVRQAYEALTPAERTALLEFLRSL